MVTAILGTDAGVFRLHNEALDAMGLSDQRVSAIHAWTGTEGEIGILAGSYGNGLFRSADGGRQWSSIDRGLTAPAFRTIMPDPHNGAILSGTEPGRIFRSHDQGVTWQELSGIRALDEVDEWFLPYSPRAGAVRNIYAPPGTDRLLASVEVGGLIASDDAGDTWHYLPVLDDTDIHHITGHSGDPDLLFAALGWASLHKRPSGSPPLGGVARSGDGGRTWEKFFSAYTRAVIVPRARPDLLLAGPANAVGGPGHIEVSPDGGETWQSAGAGIESPMKDMVELFVDAPNGSIWAICSGGRLLRAEPGEWHWSSPLPATADVNKVKSVAFLTDDESDLQIG
jgi:photosystem II stability/assembly factor-like uncharacterized protein